MRMARIMILTVWLSVILCGCKAQPEGVPVLPATVEYPSTEEGNEPYAAFRRGRSSTVLYYANTNSKKFHHKECTYAQKIGDDRLYICDDRQELINAGYEPCEMCKP